MFLISALASNGRCSDHRVALIWFVFDDEFFSCHEQAEIAAKGIFVLVSVSKNSDSHLQI